MVRRDGGGPPLGTLEIQDALMWLVLQWLPLRREEALSGLRAGVCRVAAARASIHQGISTLYPPHC